MKILLLNILLTLTSLTAYAQNNPSKTAEHVKINGNALEVVSVTESAEKCRDNKGVTIRLKVTSSTPIDAIRYVRSKSLLNERQFINTAVGDEIVDFYCYSGAVFIFYTRPAGSSEKFPRP